MSQRNASGRQEVDLSVPLNGQSQLFSFPTTANNYKGSGKLGREWGRRYSHDFWGHQRARAMCSWHHETKLAEG